MGVDFNSAKFLLWSKNLGVAFERTLTLGHLGFASSHPKLQQIVRNFGLNASQEEIDRCLEQPAFAPRYCDAFLQLLGARELVTVDRSDFEGATLLHDLNLPFPEHLKESFDLVIDGGTLEHVFNYPAALSNCLELLRVGGHFLTITPAAGLMGHGFYQFSPELFFRIFSEERGFRLRKLVIFDCTKSDAPFYEMQDPALQGERSASPLGVIMMAVLAEKIAHPPAVLEPPQQSDYAAIWKNHQQGQSESTPAKTKPPGLIRRFRIALNPYWPIWLRDLRDELRGRFNWYVGTRQGRLSNPRFYRRISNAELFNKRSAPSDGKDKP